MWSVKKVLTPMSPEEELEAWRTTVGMLDSLCGMADSLRLDPLILALGDALGRSREELARVEDRLSRPEGAQLGPREKERLMGLLRRTDALSVALDRVERDEASYPGKAEYVETLRKEHEEAREQFLRYRDEVGLPRPTRQ